MYGKVGAGGDITILDTKKSSAQGGEKSKKSKKGQV
jgi:hypothetical protein